MKRVLLSAAALLLLNGCSSDSSVPSTGSSASSGSTVSTGSASSGSTTVTNPSGAPLSSSHRRINYTSYGTVDADQVTAVQGSITELWIAHFWGEGEFAKHAIPLMQQAQLPTTIDCSDWLYPPGDYNKPLRSDALQRMITGLQAMDDADVLKYVECAVPIDEPDLDRRNVVDTLPEAQQIMLAAFAHFGLRPNLGCIYTDGKFPHTDLWDRWGADNYHVGDNALVQGGLIDRMSWKRKPSQGMIWIPGASDIRYPKAVPQLWVDKASQVDYDVHIVYFLAKDPGQDPNLVSILSVDTLAQQYLSAGRQVVAMS